MVVEPEQPLDERQGQGVLLRSPRLRHGPRRPRRPDGHVPDLRQARYLMDVHWTITAREDHGYKIGNTALRFKAAVEGHRRDVGPPQVESPPLRRSPSTSAGGLSGSPPPGCSLVPDPRPAGVDDGLFGGRRLQPGAPRIVSGDETSTDTGDARQKFALESSWSSTPWVSPVERHLVRERITSEGPESHLALAYRHGLVPLPMRQLVICGMEDGGEQERATSDAERSVGATEGATGVTWPSLAGCASFHRQVRCGRDGTVAVNSCCPSSHAGGLGGGDPVASAGGRSGRGSGAPSGMA